MLSGSWPCGSRSASSSGNTGITVGRSPILRWELRIIPLPFLWLREQQRRQPPPALPGDVGGGARGFEDGQELLARRALVPVAFAPDDLQQLVDGLGQTPLGGQRLGELEAGAEVAAVGGDALLEARGVGRRLGGERQRRFYRVEIGVLGARRRHVDDLLRAGIVAAGEVT